MESLIQVALLCTQTCPADRPKMSEVVWMLEGDCLADKLEEWQNARGEHIYDLLYHPPDMELMHNLLTDDLDDLRAIELSGPR
jgi:hypothetical protein